MSEQLAIIIPAYRAAFFRQALDSLAKQTCPDFHVYVGDDCSPEDLRSIADEFADALRIRYTRFPENMGAKKLVNQWSRCVALSETEEWIWLFSDDDIADPQCVENFYAILQKNQDAFDVYRFNTAVIDRYGKVTSVPPEGPATESSEEMAYHLLLGQRGNSMPDHIFSRNVYGSTGGFVYTDYAQSADWATSIKFSREKGICIIPDAKLFWRYSGTNLSSLAPKLKTEMFKGYCCFLEWTADHFKYLKNDAQPRISYEAILTACVENFKIVVNNHYKGMNINMLFPSYQLLHTRFKLGFWAIAKLFFHILIR